MKLLDTCFLIDLQREFRVGAQGPARAYLERHASERHAVSVVSLTEFLEGFENPIDGEALLRPFMWLAANRDVAREAARIRRQLRTEGRLIGDFDILIAATARVGDMELVTDDAEPFARIAGLKVEAYR